MPKPEGEKLSRLLETTMAHRSAAYRSNQPRIGTTYYIIKMAPRSLLGAFLLFSVADSLVTLKISPTYCCYHPFRKDCSTITKSRLLFSEYHYEESTTELLEALLHEADMAPLRTRQREYGYQRARLGEQLRLLNKKKKGRYNGHGGSNDYSYQRKRLEEQLRLNKRVHDGEKLFNIHDGGVDMFQRKRLEEQLKYASISNQDENKTEQTSARKDFSVDCDLEGLHSQLANLHSMTDLAARPPLASNSTGLTIYNKVSRSTNKKEDSVPLLKMLTSTHLPMPPREDASLPSLCLAPLAHFASSVFLLGAAAFYAIMSILDVVVNDAKTKSCLNEARHVCISSFVYLIHSFTAAHRTRVLSRIVESTRIFFVALWYSLKCTALRATRSKYADDCLETGTGSLRYAVYAIRSISVLWHRLMATLRLNATENKKSSNPKQIFAAGTKPSSSQSWKRRLHVSRLISSIKESKKKSRDRRKHLQLKQQQARLEQEYKEKLRTLNQDRILLEREKRALEEERSELICESMNFLVWCSALTTESSSIVKTEESQKGWKSWWKAWD